MVVWALYVICWIECPQRVLETLNLHSKDEVVWLWLSLVNLYILLTVLSWYWSITLTLGLIWKDGGWSTLDHSWGFACQQRMLKSFLDLAYLCSKHGVAWLWHDLLILYIWLTILLCDSSIILALGLTGRDEGLITLSHSCRFTCQQRMLKTFLGPSFLLSNDGVVWLWHSLINLYIWLTILTCYS